MTSEPSAASSLVSLIIVSWNRRADLKRALSSVAAQDYRALEIIVVDNGSNDGTARMLERGDCGPLTLYRAERNLGASVARNVGLRLATGRWAAFMDSDAELMGPAPLRDLLARLAAEESLGAVGPAIYSDGEQREPWFLAGYYLRGRYVDQDRSRLESERPEYLSTCFSVWRRSLLQRLGGFDPALPYGFEDNDLSWRVLNSGSRLAVEPRAAVAHHLSPRARIRPESAGWSHFVYDERARCLLQLKRLGFWGFVREEAWQWSAAGRRQRHFIYLNAPLSRRQKAWLFVSRPLAALAAHPWASWRRRVNWLEEAPLDEERVVRVQGAGGGSGPA